MPEGEGWWLQAGGGAPRLRIRSAGVARLLRCARNDRLRRPGSVPAALAMTGFENRGSVPAARAMTGFEDRALRTPSPTLPRYCREGIQGIVASPCAREKGAERF